VTCSAKQLKRKTTSTKRSFFFLGSDVTGRAEGGRRDRALLQRGASGNTVRCAELDQPGFFIFAAFFTRLWEIKTRCYLFVLSASAPTMLLYASRLMCYNSERDKHSDAPSL
jgi:hypothetical protein